MFLMSRGRAHGYGAVLDCIKNGGHIFFAIKFIVAIQRNKFPILIKDDLPVDFCSWACLVPECEVKGVNDITYLDLDG